MASSDFQCEPCSPLCLKERRGAEAKQVALKITASHVASATAGAARQTRIFTSTALEVKMQVKWVGGQAICRCIT